MNKKHLIKKEIEDFNLKLKEIDKKEISSLMKVIDKSLAAIVLRNKIFLIRCQKV